jgi:hypothetical protein
LAFLSEVLAFAEQLEGILPAPLELLNFGAVWGCPRASTSTTARDDETNSFTSICRRRWWRRR